MTKFIRHYAFRLAVVLILLSTLGLTGVFAQNTPAMPSGIQIEPGQGRPTFTWDDDTSVTRWHVWIGTSDYMVSHFFDTLNRNADLCDGTTCTFKPDINPLAGQHAVFMLAENANGTSNGGQYQGWAGPVLFNISNNPPANANLTVNSDSANPTLTWPGVDRATWYQVWVGTPGPSYIPVIFKWFKAEDIGCGNGSADTCTVDEGLNLPQGARYLTYMQVWGPAGFSAGNIANVPNWIEGPQFVVGNVPATTVEAEVLALVNAERKNRGLTCLAAHPLLTQAAQGHSDDMRNRNYFSHNTPEGVTFGERVRAAGYPLLSGGENIAAGQRTSQAVYNSWFTSEGHRNNMLNPNYHEIGIALAEGGGAYGYYWTMVLGTRTGSNPTPC